MGVSSGSLSPAFSSNTYQYSLRLAPGTTSVFFTPSVSSGATLSYMLNESAINTTVLTNLTNGSSNRLSLKVVSEDESTSNDYQVDVRVQFIQDLLQKQTASDAAAGDGFGLSVSISGNTAVIGSPRNNSSGSAYIFTRSGEVWSEQTKLTASDAAAGDEFGASVSISDDTAVIGASFNDIFSGSAYVFTRSGDVWSEQTNLKASDAAAFDQFGVSVSVYGETAFIGANGNDDAGGDSGSAYVFTRSGDVWSEQTNLKASDAAAGDQFGVSVSVYGETAFIGANGNDDAGGDSGSAYVFTRSGDVWSEQTNLKASDAAAGDQFGVSVSVSVDTAVIGANLNDDAGSNSGSAYIYSFVMAMWSEQIKLTASDTAAGDEFGASVSISDDTAVIGARGNGDDGSVYTLDIP